MTALRRRLCALPSLLLLLTVALPAQAAHTLWAVKHGAHTLYLLGSVHVLPQDAQLPDVALQAYRRADTVVLEVDAGELTPETLAPQMMGSALLPEGQSLQQVIGAPLYQRVQKAVAPLGVGAEFLDSFQPWFAATMLEMLALTKSGYDPNAGVDLQIAMLAKQDNKPVIGLETLQEQLGFLAGMDSTAQREYLASTLNELDGLHDEVEALVRAWRAGDIATLEAELRRSQRESPQLMTRLTTERNRRWLPRIVTWLGEERDYLVCVGALHLVGEQGVVNLLRKKGYEVVQQ